LQLQRVSRQVHLNQFGQQWNAHHQSIILERFSRNAIEGQAVSIHNTTTVTDHMHNAALRNQKPILQSFQGRKRAQIHVKQITTAQVKREHTLWQEVTNSVKQHLFGPECFHFNLQREEQEQPYDNTSQLKLTLSDRPQFHRQPSMLPAFHSLI
jgi:hypothetical protein